jgi:hypothetical protein
MRIHLAMLRSAAWLVPGEQRAEWLAEWRGELWHVRRICRGQATGFCLGAFRDAFWLRRNGPAEGQPARWLESPARCLGFLGLVASGCVLVALGRHLLDLGQPVGGPILAMVSMALMALPMLPAITSLSLGEYPANGNGWRWVFLVCKIALVLPIVLFGVLNLADMVGLKIQSGPLLCIWIGNVAALRWVLIDQRRRCPVCLRLLKHPAPIGEPSHVFLEWYGTEFACGKGHGLLHVPEIPTVSFRTQSWMRLDRSWSGLFL